MHNECYVCVLSLCPQTSLFENFGFVFKMFDRSANRVNPYKTALFWLFVRILRVSREDVSSFSVLTFRRTC